MTSKLFRLWKNATMEILRRSSAKRLDWQCPFRMEAQDRTGVFTSNVKSRTRWHCLSTLQENLIWLLSESTIPMSPFWAVRFRFPQCRMSIFEKWQCLMIRLRITASHSVSTIAMLWASTLRRLVRVFRPKSVRWNFRLTRQNKFNSCSFVTVPPPY